ncbi:MAG: hypothetical protein JST11_16820, partial [Acidobacteria bacterium]|nr:hypothetical protein [Acidobacteriota bacterium]
DQSATLTATYNGGSASTTISLVASVSISSLACNPSSIGPSSSSTCTITLTKAAPSGGAPVTISSGNPLLSAPATVTVPANTTSATFNATTAAIATDQSATLTATYNGGSANTTISLAASARVSSLACNPTSLGPNSSSTCTITLTKAAPNGGAAVTISSGNALLSVPATVTIAANATSATFSATTAAIATDQSATLTAAYNGASANAAISLLASASISSLVCSPSSLGPNSSSICTVNLTKVAPSGGAAVTISSGNALLSVPATVTVAANTTSATFSATTAAIATDQNATLTATYNNGSVNTTIGLAATIVVSSLVCSPTTLGPLDSSTCTVTLTRSAPAGANVLVSSNNASLPVPPSIFVAAGYASAVFTLQAGSFTSSQSGSVTASYNGSSRSAAISLVPPALVTSLACNPTGVFGPSTTSCTATLSQPAPTNTAVAVSSSTNLITVPASILVAAGNSTATFTANIGSVTTDTAGSVTATLGGSSRTATLTLWSTPVLSSLTCTATKLAAGSSTVCTVTLSKAAGNSVVNLASNMATLTLPATVTVPQGAQTASFTATTTASALGWIIISATFNGTRMTFLLTVTAPPAPGGSTSTVRTITCRPRSLEVGFRGICRITLDRVTESADTTLHVSSSSASLLLPKTVTVRRGRATAEFRVDATGSGEDVVVAAALGTDVVQDSVALTGDRAKRIRVPQRQFVRYGSEVRFRVSPADPSATVSTAELPSGAYFDPVNGEFWWTPDITQVGDHDVVFTAADSSGVKTSASVVIQVDTGEPVATRVVNAASRSAEAVCGPGTIAAIEGRWLTGGAAASDTSGGSIELAGSRVWVNGIPVPVLSASPTELTLLCPDSVPGSDLAFVVQTDHGVAKSLRTTARSAAPGVFSLDGSGSGEGLVLLEHSRAVAVVRNYQLPSQPAVPGERIVFYATGVDHLTNLSVHLGDRQVAPVSVKPVPDHVGLFEISVAVPDDAADNSDLRLSFSGDTPEGMQFHSNEIRIAVETASR